MVNMEAVKAFWARRTAEYVAARSFVSLCLASRKAGKERGASAGELEVLLQAMGAKAGAAGLCPELPAATETTRSAEVRGKAATVVAERKQAEEQARQRLEQERQKHAGIIGALSEEAGRLNGLASSAKSDLHTAQKQVVAIENEIQRIQKLLADLDQGKPGSDSRPVLTQKLAAAQQTLLPAQAAVGPAEKRHAEAQTLADAKQAEHTQARRTWKQLGGECEAQLKAATDSVKLAEGEVVEAEKTLAAAHLVFGRAIFAAGARPAEIVGELDRATQIQTNIQNLDSTHAALDQQAAAVKPGAMGFALWSGGTIVALIVLVLVVRVAIPGKSKPATVAGARSTTTPTSMPAAAPQTPRDNPVRNPFDALPQQAAKHELTPALQKAILAHPALAMRWFDADKKQPRFQPTGKVTARQWSDRVDGGCLVEVVAEVQTWAAADAQPATSRVVMRAVVSAEGAYVSGEMIGSEDADTDALLKLLGR